MPKYEPSHLKNMNTKIVFREFQRKSNENLFVNEIAKTRNISVPTVMKIVDFLMEKELIKEGECTWTGVGRKPNMLRLNRDKYFSVGVIYEGEYLTLGIVDLAGEVQNFIQVKCGQEFEESLFQNVDRLLKMSGRKAEELVGIGIGMPCIFEQEERKITAPLIGINEAQYFGDVIDRIADTYKAKVVVDNDLNVQAFGEYESIRPGKKEDLIFISLGTGLGAGVVIDGKARRGNHNICGEIGYMMFEYSDEKPKSGWLEEKINLKALRKLFGTSGEGIEKKEEAIEYVSRYLALLINNLIFCYDVSKIVLDGHVIETLGDDLLREVQNKLNKICYKPLQIQKKTEALPGISGGALLASNAWLEELFK